ncbi:hypothetical protein E2C01_084834 [Portunus trituberculatus]|uniref:Uncharacterized protein n=1 Tax=Portunus trituberculatus TaxID=210409 RepID=A0A5B7J109_PORTR|nr:hypothetical protein [Portunus trituberculatus]
MLRPARNILHYHHHLRLRPRSPPLHVPFTSPSHEAQLLSRCRICVAPFELKPVNTPLLGISWDPHHPALHHCDTS